MVHSLTKRLYTCNEGVIPWFPGAAILNPLSLGSSLSSVKLLFTKRQAAERRCIEDHWEETAAGLRLCCEKVMVYKEL